LSDVVGYIDLLTGAWKKGHFELHLARAVAKAQRLGEPLSLLLVDVDQLQEHNDVHGATQLDDSIGWLATKISDVVNGRGPIGRVGGGSFAVFLPGFSELRALRLAQRMRRAVAATPHASDSGDYRLTVSVGVATLRRGEPWGNLLEAAERACLKAKQGGRDTVAAR
jgi:diguanylate cyclase (GGDEF)-like protein